MSDELEAQIAQEKAELDNAPKVPVSQYQPTVYSGRCSFCGQPAMNLIYVDAMHGTERFRGDCCGGLAYRIPQ